jgi:GDP-L-fucose synthase
MTPESRIYVAGHTGLVGSALLRALQNRGYENVLVVKRSVVDLRDRAEVRAFFARTSPEYVFAAAATVGGIGANIERPADMIQHNLDIATNIIDSCYMTRVKKLLMLGSSCIYPRGAPQPMEEEYLLTGSLEPTNRAYALAKIAAIELCNSYRRQHDCDFISAIPCNLYGPGDTYAPDWSHVIPALIRKLHRAKVRGDEAVEIWGTGREIREFLHSDDLANACLVLMGRYGGLGPINVGSGEEITIAHLAKAINAVVKYPGRIWCNQKRPGVARKLVDSSKMREMGWEPRISLAEGLPAVYEDYLSRT